MVVQHIFHILNWRYILHHEHRPKTTIFTKVNYYRIDPDFIQCAGNLALSYRISLKQFSPIVQLLHQQQLIMITSVYRNVRTLSICCVVKPHHVHILVHQTVMEVFHCGKVISKLSVCNSMLDNLQYQTYNILDLLFALLLAIAGTDLEILSVGPK